MGIYRTVPLSTTKDFFNVIKLWYMLSDILMIEDDHMPIAGYVLIIDASNITMDYLTVLSVSIIKQFFTYFQEAFPIRIKGIHFVARKLTIVQTFYNVWKMLMKQKIRERVSVHLCTLSEFEIHKNHWKYLEREHCTVSYVAHFLI